MNLSSLTCIQVSNALIPLLITPYVIITLGANSYSHLAIAEAASVLVLAVTLYSFEIDGVTEAIATKRDENYYNIMSSLFSQIFLSRIFLLIASSAFGLLVLNFIFKESVIIFILYLLNPFSQVLYNYWLYQANEHNIIPAVTTLTARLSATIAVFIFVKGSNDAWLVPALLGGFSVLGGFASFLFAQRQFKLKFSFQALSAIWTRIVNGRAVFFSNLSVATYREVNVLILGAVGTPAAGIAAYSLAEKTIKMIQACTRPLNQLFFPKLVRSLQKYTTPGPEAARTIFKFTLPQLVIVTGLALAGVGILLLFDLHRLEQYAIKIPDNLPLLTAIMAPAMLLGICNFMFGMAGLTCLHKRNVLLKVIAITAVQSVAMCAVLGWFFGATGGAIAFAAAEFFLFIMVLKQYFFPGLDQNNAVAAKGDPS